MASGSGTPASSNITRPGLDHGDPAFRRALAGAHAGLGRLLREALVGEDVDPDLAAALDLARHRDTGGLDLAVRDPAAVDRLQAVVAELDGRLALRRRRAGGRDGPCGTSSSSASTSGSALALGVVCGGVAFGASLVGVSSTVGSITGVLLGVGFSTAGSCLRGRSDAPAALPLPPPPPAGRAPAPGPRPRRRRARRAGPRTAGPRPPPAPRPRPPPPAAARAAPPLDRAEALAILAAPAAALARRAETFGRTAATAACVLVAEARSSPPSCRSKPSGMISPLLIQTLTPMRPDVGPRLDEAVVDVGADRVQRDAALAVSLAPAHLAAAEAARALDLHAGRARADRARRARASSRAGTRRGSRAARRSTARRASRRARGA